MSNSSPKWTLIGTAGTTPGAGAGTRPDGAGADAAAGEPVLRGDRAGVATAASFDVDLRSHAAARSDVPAQSATAARATGYASGWAEGRQAALHAARAEAERVAAVAERAAAEQAGRVHQALAALARAAGRLDQRSTPNLVELEDTVVAAAFALAEAIVGRELATAAEPGRDALARVLALAPANLPVTVRLHPADLATLTAADGAATREIDGRTVTLVPDPGLQVGDAIADCDTTTIDARIAAALDRAREVLFR